MTQQEIKDKIADWKTRLKNPSVASVASAVKRGNEEIAKYEAMLEDEKPAKVKAPKTEKKEKVEKEPKTEKSETKESKKDIKGSAEVLLYRTPKKSDLEVGLKVAYKDTYGEFTKTGKIDSINGNLYTIGKAEYTADELRLLKGSKAEEKPTQKESKKDDYDCDDLIKEAKERHAKAKAAAEARAEAPKKTEATKDKEKIEKVHEAVEKQVEAGKLTKKQLVTLINETKDLLKLLEKALKNL
jgi:rRNA maturation endonuclease Nob1